jgi:hypothetical protein
MKQGAKDGFKEALLHIVDEDFQKMIYVVHGPWWTDCLAFLLPQFQVSIEDIESLV